jgi:leukotriene-A4 hydrolase
MTLKSHNNFSFNQQQSSVIKDYHSFSNPQQVRVVHLDLELDVSFGQKVLKGSATLTIQRTSQGNNAPLILDTRELNVTKAEVSTDGAHFIETEFNMGQQEPILGAPLVIRLPEGSTQVRLEYSTSSNASGLQWLEPAQTAGKMHPFMYTQSQTIHARSWIPLQDSPQVRITYNALIKTPSNLFAVMSAKNDAQTLRNGDYHFKMMEPIPSYLIALAVGDIIFNPIGTRTGIYAEPKLIERSVKEFEDTEKMIVAAESLYGPYLWGRYDLLILPPSFPLGGMENPRLTFVTPTVLAGDKSLVSIVAHELAHSWSGNLVNNATWSDFWLNEGFTVYVERRILEEVYGKQRAEMEAVLGRQYLDEEISTLADEDTILYINLKERDPDEGFSKIPYEKGSLFLRHLEETFGRALFDTFLRNYFNAFAFKSITTANFIAYLHEHLLDKNPQLAAQVPVEEWIYQPGLPNSAPCPMSDTFANVEKQAKSWLQNEITTSNIPTAQWTTQEWLNFLRCLPQQLELSRMEEIDRIFHMTDSSNSEIANQWLIMAIHNSYEPAYEKLENYLTTIGRMKYIKPLYKELVTTSEGKERALEIYKKARTTYHSIAVTAVDEILEYSS